MVDNRFEQRDRMGKARAVVERLEGAADAAERAAPSADHERIGQGETQPADAAGLAVHVAQEIGEHAGDAARDRLQPQVVVVGQKQRTRPLRNRRLGDEIAGTLLRQREVQPQPGARLMQRPRSLAGVEPLGRPLAETIGKHEAGNFDRKAVGYTGIEHGGSWQGRTCHPCKIDAEASRPATSGAASRWSS